MGDKLEEEWKLERMNYAKPLLLRALWRMFRKDILLYGAILFIQEFVLGYFSSHFGGFSVLILTFFFSLSQPLALGKLMNYYTPHQTRVSLQEAYLYAGVLILTSFLSVVVSHSYMLASHHLGMKMRIACCSLIYRFVAEFTSLYSLTNGSFLGKP